MIIERLPQKIRGIYRENYNLAKTCRLNVGGPAEVLFKPRNIDDLVYFLRNKPNDISVTVLGVGSNVLIRDAGIKGVTIKFGKDFNYVGHNDGLEVQTGVATLDLNVAKYCMGHGIGGLEFLSGIPGAIGGAIAMNAGAYGSDVASTIVSVKAVSRLGEIKTFQKAKIGYKYRFNSLSDDWIFVEAIFQGYEKPKEEIDEQINYIQEARKQTQPIRHKTGGSTFKNPPGQKAWKLIDKAGCRELNIGGAYFSEQHCNFLINDGTATAWDIEQLILEAKRRVYANTGVLLEEEIKFVGDR